MAGKKRDIDDGPKMGVGLVMTVSLFLILLTFFILLNSIAVIDERKKLVAIGSLMGAFGSLSGGLSPSKTGESIMTPFAPMTDEGIDIVGLLSHLEKTTVGQVKVQSTKGREVITINERVLFGKDRLRLKPSSYLLLDELWHIMKMGEYPVEIVGYTDSRPGEEKGFKSNWEVSSFMAIQVLKYFVAKSEITPERLSAFGRGSNSPIASNATRESRAQNRRVDIVLRFRAPLYVKRILKKKPKGIFTYKDFDFRIF
ncbi:MAG: OmpA family protein [Deltaproteobacteria bacterium]|nr:OmpA family protein [Deltaproteobacteria bacterium]